MTLESYTDKATINRAAENAARFFSFDDESARLADESGRSARRAAALRLVKGAKSPTDRFPGATGAYFNRKPAGYPPAPREIEEPRGYSENCTTAGTWAVVERRQWAGEWRLRFEHRPACAVQTPDNSGDRVTALLSERGARKISESCYFLACTRGGYSTFATLTLSESARRDLQRQTLQPAGNLQENGFSTLHPTIEPARAKQGRFAPAFVEENQITEAYEAGTLAAEYSPLHYTTGRPYTPLKTEWSLSVQREASRFFEAAGQMYKRGWQYRRPGPAGKVRRDDTTGAFYTPIQWQTVKVPGSRAVYCVEGPDTDKRTGAPYTRLKWWRELVGSREPRPSGRTNRRIPGRKPAHSFNDAVASSIPAFQSLGAAP